MAWTVDRDARRLRRAALAAAIALAAFAAILLLPEGRPRQDLVNVALTLAALAAAAGCALAMPKAKGHERRAWALMAAAAASWGLGQAAWTALQWLAPADIPFPSVADVGYGAFYVFAVASSAAFIAHERGALGQGRLVLGGLVGGLSVFALSWALVLREVYSTTPAEPLAQALGLAYPLGDAILLTGLLVRVGRPGATRLPFALLAAGIVGIALSDGVYAVQTARQAYVVGTLADLGWLAGFLALALAGYSACVRPPAAVAGRPAHVAAWTVPVLLILVLLTMAVLTWEEVVQEGDDHVVLAAGMAIGVLLLLWLFTVAEENRRLAESLEARRREAVEAARAAAESEARFRQLAEGLPSVFVLAEPDRVIYANPAYEQLFGRPVEELVRDPRSWLAAVHPADQERLRRFMAADRDWRREDAVEYRIVRPGGEVRWVRSRFAAVPGDRGVWRVAGHVVDITDMKAAQEVLRDSEARFRALVEGSADMVAVLDTAGRITYISPSVARLLAHRPEDVVGTEYAGFLHPDDRGAATAAVAEAFATPGASPQVTVRIRAKDGSYRTFEATGSNHLDDPHVRGLVINAHDVTDLLAAQEAVRASEARFRALVEGGNDVVAVVDETGRVAYVSPGVERLLGRRPEDLVGTSYTHLLHPDDLARAAESFLAARDRPGPSPPLTVRMRTKDGSYRSFEGTAMNRLADPHIRGIVVHTTDVTDRVRAKAAEEEARARVADADAARQRDAFKTRFLNMAAHEMNTPLTPIQLQLDLLASGRHGPLTEAQRRDVQMLQRNFRSLARLAQDLVAAAGMGESGGAPGVRARDRVDLAALARTCAADHADAAKAAGVALEVHAAKEAAVLGDAAALGRALDHLVENAVKFNQPGGRVVIEVAAEGRDAEVRVADTGVGFEAQRAALLFQPFSQLHDPMQRTRAGAGLGLYLVRRTAELHGGEAGASSPGPGKGATFWLRLPLAAQEKPAAADAADAAAPRRGA